MSRYSGDPRWIYAKYAGRDADGNPIRPGDRVFYFPRTRTIYTGAKAEQAARDFQAAAEDEDNYARQYGGGFDGGDGQW